MRFRVDPASPIPIYSQIMDQVRCAVAAGALKPDDELPSVRAMATEQLINPNTVARAYLELEREGLVTKKRGTGTFVSPEAARLGEGKRKQIVAALLDKALAQAMQFQMPARQTRDLFEERLRELSDQPERGKKR